MNPYVCVTAFPTTCRARVRRIPVVQQHALTCSSYLATGGFRNYSTHEAFVVSPFLLLSCLDGTLEVPSLGHVRITATDCSSPPPGPYLSTVTRVGLQRPPAAMGYAHCQTVPLPASAACKTLYEGFGYVGKLKWASGFKARDVHTQ